MELKSYQERVLSDLKEFLEYVEAYPDVKIAFREYWQYKGLARPLTYTNTVPGVPDICIKVPTAGGKTFIAANALKPIFDAMLRINPTKPKVVAWLVPSLAILDQTYQALNDPLHPYRQRINTHFNGRVGVFRKDDVLFGTGFTPDEVREQLNILVLVLTACGPATKTAARRIRKTARSLWP